MNSENQTTETPAAQELAKIKKQRDGLLRAITALEARGFFEHSARTDKGTAADLRAMRRAIKAAKGGDQ